MLKKTINTKLSIFISISVGLIGVIYAAFYIYQLKNSRKQALEFPKKAEHKIKYLYEKYPSNAFGLDISRYQKTIDWNLLKENQIIPISFIFIKATQGSNKKDPFFKTNWKKSKKHNFIRGAYHYYEPDVNSRKQAENFINSVELLKSDLPPVLDIEELPKNQSLEKLKVGLLNWISIVEKHYGVKPIIYSNDAYFIYHIADLDLENYPIWVANYNPIKQPLHEKWYFWQFTDQAVLKGIENFVDINLFNGTLEDLNKLLIK